MRRKVLILRGSKLTTTKHGLLQRILQQKNKSRWLVLKWYAEWAEIP